MVRQNRNIAATNMITCKQASQLISDKLDRDLSLWQRLNLKLHLFMCHYCSKYARQLRFLHSASSQLDQHIENNDQHSLSPESKQKFKTAIKNRD